jgi:poly-beta-hydroxybutyrate-responsive repressor
MGDGRWRVHARVERFNEPALLLILRDGSTHGYELADNLAEMLPAERIDMGNLYRMLRALEAEGIVESEWRDDVPGRNRRTYRLTEQGESLLDTWAEALGEANETITAFLERYQEGEKDE